MRHWYLVRSQRHRETQAETAIRQLGLEVYVPRETRWAIHGRKRIVVQAPLFRGYLFSRFDAGFDHWWLLRRSHWVDDITCTGDGDPIRIPERQVVAIQLAESAKLYDFTRPVPPDCPFLSGDRVRVKEGPMAGLLAEVRTATSARRVEILFELLGKAVVPACNLERV